MSYKKLSVILGVMAIIIVLVILTNWTSKEVFVDNVEKVEAMTIVSPAFMSGGDMPAMYTCDGVNISPPLEFANVPRQTKSLALVVDDPDVPSGTWVHWLVWNIPPQTIGVHAGQKIDGAVEGFTSFGRNGYGGPCPPEGEHRYYFKLYALNTTLNLLPTLGTRLEKIIEPNIIQKVELIGKYKHIVD